jgi:DNA polymerase I-like protein with 3'-5' exonuclease and polymerase domains
MIRGLFIPEDGTKWCSFDYSSQEPRLLVHFAASMPDAMRHPVVDTIVDEYNTGDVDLHQMVADIAGIKRKEAKVVNLGIMYGMGKAKLASQLSISEAEAAQLLDTHKEKVPFVRQLATIASKRAEENGQIRTLLGRVCRFNDYEPKTFGYSQALPLEEAVKKYGSVARLKRAFTYKALNKLIQGSAADQTKKAMADCYEAGLTPLLTVHDELCFSIESDDQAKQIKDIMENGLSNILKVPSKVDFEAADDWGGIEG